MPVLPRGEQVVASFEQNLFRQDTWAGREVVDAMDRRGRRSESCGTPQTFCSRSTGGYFTDSGQVTIVLTVHCAPGKCRL